MTRPDPLAKLIEQLQRLPGIGAKSAQRLAYHILKTPREEVDRLGDAMREVKERITYCSTCSNITDVDPCFFCTNPSRDQRLICVVEEPENVNGVEKTRQFNGLYQVLMAFKFGGTVVLEKMFLYPGRYLELIAKERVTGLPIVPALKRFRSLESRHGRPPSRPITPFSATAT